MFTPVSFARPQMTYAAPREEVCYVCFEDEAESGEPVHAFCDCSLRAHIECLRQWVSARQTGECTICKKEYQLEPRFAGFRASLRRFWLIAGDTEIQEALDRVHRQKRSLACYALAVLISLCMGGLETCAYASKPRHDHSLDTALGIFICTAFVPFNTVLGVPTYLFLSLFVFTHQGDCTHGQAFVGFLFATMLPLLLLHALQNCTYWCVRAIWQRGPKPLVRTETA